MAKKSIVHCRICKGEIDRNILEETIDWIMPSKNYFYHKDCYDTWGKKKNDVEATGKDDEWFDLLYDYLRRDVRMSIDFPKLKKQWESYLKKGMTAKGIFFCSKYFYEIKKGDVSKSEGGIGIIPYIYKEGAEYWSNRNQKDKGICDRIEQQLKLQREQEKIVVRQQKKKPKKGYNLADIFAMENE